MPAATPVTIPEEGSIVAKALLPLLHAPPVMASDNVVETNVQTDAEAGVIAVGVALTVADLVAEQPAALV